MRRLFIRSSDDDTKRYLRSRIGKSTDRAQKMQTGDHGSSAMDTKTEKDLEEEVCYSSSL